jgi:RNA polymerase sigma-70 factor (ECF subfamily)
MSKEELEEIYRNLRVMAFSLPEVNNEMLAEDLVHGAMAQGLEKINQYQEGNPGGWFFTIMKRLNSDRLRSADNVRINRELDQEFLENVSIEDNSEKAYEREQLMKKIKEVLSEEQFDVVFLHSAGHTHKDIGMELGIPMGTSLSRYSRAIEKLRNELDWNID